MAQRMSVNLGLGAIPEIETQDRNLYNEFIRIYNAIKLLSSNTDKITGLTPPDPELWVEAPMNQSALFGNMTKVYRVAIEDIDYGNLVSFQSAGVRKAAALNATWYKAHGFCSATQGVKAGDVGEFQLMGMVRASGLIAGKTYYLGTGGSIVDAYGILNYTPPLGPGAGIAHVYQPAYNGFGFQKVGIALTPEDLYINPNNTFHRYTEGTQRATLGGAYYMIGLMEVN